MVKGGPSLNISLLDNGNNKIVSVCQQIFIFCCGEAVHADQWRLLPQIEMQTG